jgi:hypothetical protein
MLQVSVTEIRTPALLQEDGLPSDRISTGRQLLKLIADWQAVTQPV